MTLPAKKVVFINGAGQDIGKGELVVYTIAQTVLSGDDWRRRGTADGRMHAQLALIGRAGGLREVGDFALYLALSA